MDDVRQTRMQIPAEYLKLRFRVDDQGRLFWLPFASRPRWWNTVWAGKQAGSQDRDGYLTVKITRGGKTHTLRAHQIVWALTHGAWPARHIDHINRIKTDNRPCNLRVVDIATNNQNKTPRDLPLGVFRIRDKFKAQRMIDGALVYLGSFDNPDDAHRAYLTGVPVRQRRTNLSAR